MSTYTRLLSKTASAEVNMEEASNAYYAWMDENVPNYQNELTSAQLNDHFTNQFLPVYMENKVAADREWYAKTAEAEQMGVIIGTRAAEILENAFAKIAKVDMSYPSSKSLSNQRREALKEHPDSVVMQARREAANARRVAPGTARGLAQDLIPGGRGAAHYDQLHHNLTNAAERASEYIRSRPGAAMDTLKAHPGKAALIGAGVAGTAYAANRMRKQSSDGSFEAAVGEQLDAYATIIEHGGLIDTGTPAADQWDYEVKNTALAIMAEDGIV